MGIERNVDDMNIGELEQIIRGYVNAPHRHTQLIVDESAFNQLCSAMDCIGDAEMALAAYKEMEDPGEPGERYIAVYGVLQLLYVEQDAIAGLSKILGLDEKRPQYVRTVRAIRNCSVGHPTRTTDGVSHFISRADLKIGSFRLISRSPNGQTKITLITLHDLVKDQQDALAKILRQVVRRLKEDEMAHREKYRDQKLVEFLSPSIAYLISKIQEGTLPGADKVIAGANLEMTKNAIDAFRQALADRGRERAAAETIDEINYPLEELDRYFRGDAGARLNDKDAYIFGFFVADRVQLLRRIAQEIDDEYAADDLPR